MVCRYNIYNVCGQHGNGGIGLVAHVWMLFRDYPDPVVPLVRITVTLPCNVTNSSECGKHTTKYIQSEM